MHKYEIVLKNEKESTYSIISWLLLSSNFISIILLTISFDFKKFGPFILSLLAVAAIFLGRYFKRKNENVVYYWTFFIFSMAWFITPYDWPGYVNLLFGILDSITRRKLSIYFYTDRIIYPSPIPKKISWTDVNNAILKDGIITIDMKNNKLLQQHLDDISPEINEEEFNDFCRQQLSK